MMSPVSRSVHLFSYVVAVVVCLTSLADDRRQAQQLPPAPKLPLTQPAAQQQEKPPKPVAFNNPAEAGEDYRVQGEYTGQIETADGKLWHGIQIVAGGEGQFDVVIYPGGLPGNGWDGPAREQSSGELADGRLTFSWGEGTAELFNKKIHVRDADGNPLGRLSKVVRKSRTLGLLPPPHATVLFDGSNADAFEGGQVTDDGLLRQGVTSHEKFQDFRLHLEFQTPFMPTARSQQRGNSGVYMQGRYEVQILDSFGLEGHDNEAGGIYTINPPDVNMAFPPLTWQTYDVDFTAPRFDEGGHKVAEARMTVRHNGILVQNDVAVPQATRAAPVPEGPEPGPLYLQDHGNPVRYRNIWIVAMSEVGDGQSLSADEPRDDNTDWIDLFDGETLTGWHLNPEKIGHGTGGHWFVEDGAIVGEQDPPGSGNGGILLTDATFGDFELEIDMKPDWGVCSGLFLRGTDVGQCFQMMVDYHDAGNVGHVYGEGTGGFSNRPFSMFGETDDDNKLISLRTEPVEGAAVGNSISGPDWVKAWKVGEWNTARVRVEGQPPVITTWINGVQVMKFDGASFEHSQYDKAQVAETLGERGHIAVQVHGGKGWPQGAVCRWRNIRVKPLD